MNPSEIYFYRNRGPWDWNVDLKILSYRDLWRDNIPLVSKIRLSMFSFSQAIFGSYSMWTKINFQKNSDVVYHSTKLRKWGITFYSSEKEFKLKNDGKTLHLQGEEFFWPLNFISVAFAPSLGEVDESTMGATYKMPLAGASCDCKSYLDQPSGYMKIHTPWLEGKISLIKPSQDILRQRLKDSNS